MVEGCFSYSPVPKQETDCLKGSLRNQSEDRSQKISTNVYVCMITILNYWKEERVREIM